MFAETKRATIKLWVALSASTVFVQNAAAQTNSTSSGLPCSPPADMQPLFDLLNSITELAFLAGVGLATLTFVIAGGLLIAPGEDYARLGKKVAKNGLFGVILLLSANMITGFLVSELGTTICS